MAASKTSGITLSAEEKRQRALELRMKGWKLVDIQKDLGYRSISSVHKTIKVALDRTIKLTDTDAERLRARELMDLDYLRLSLEPRIAGETVRNEAGDIVSHIPSGDVQAVDAARRISESRRKLMGIDAPERVVIGEDNTMLAVPTSPMFDGEGGDE